MSKKDIYNQTLLYDFYGELLSKQKKEYYEKYLLEDLSLGEIAEIAGISRQAVYDSIKKSDKSLEDYESKLHLVEKFLDMKTHLKIVIDKLDENKFDEAKKDLINLIDEL